MLSPALSYYHDADAGNFVISGRESCIEPRNFYRAYRAFLQSAGLPPYTFHILRHTFATRCVEQGFDVKSLSEILGHADVSMTLRRYVHRPWS